MSADKYEIEITITVDGRIVSEVKGVKGPSCSEISKWLDSLGEVEEDKHTPDFYQERHQTVTTSK